MRVFRPAVLALVLARCAAPGPSKAPSASGSLVPASTSEELKGARAQRDSASRLEPPSLPADASPPAVVSFMKESVAAWVKARRAAVDDCVENFRSAAKVASPSDRAAVMLEASEAALEFVSAYGKVADQIATALATDTATKAELLAAFRESEGPHIEVARNVLRECVESDDQGSPPSGAVEKCRELLSKTPATSAP
jgi:hypothetical protein